MQRHSEVFWLPAFGSSGIQGGVCISIADVWKSAIVDPGIVVPGHAQWLLLQWEQTRVGLLNLYASNHASARATFWFQISESLPRANAWCVGGDFNMLETVEDRRGGSQTTVHGSELAGDTTAKLAPTSWLGFEPGQPSLQSGEVGLEGRQWGGVEGKGPLHVRLVPRRHSSARDAQATGRRPIGWPFCAAGCMEMQAWLWP